MIDHGDRISAQVPSGRWLLTQRDRGDWIDGIADAARADRTLLKNGDPEAGRAHLRKQRVNGDVLAAIDDKKPLSGDLTERLLHPR